MTTRTLAATAAALPDDTTLDRRTMIASAGAILAASKTSESATNAIEPDDALLLALQQPWQDLRDAFERKPRPRTDATVARFTKAEDKIIRRLVDTPARTLAGLAFKAEVSKNNDHAAPEIIVSIMDDILAVAATKAEDERKPTFDEYADSDFGPCGTQDDVQQLRPVYEDHWPVLALAMSVLTKSSDELATLVDTMEKGGDAPLLKKMIGGISTSGEWFAKTAEMMETATTRLMCGMCRSAKAKGLSREGD